ncbi:MAG: hypothetical protein EDX89_16860 [Acidobacteria bacterium]|nr:MAG: hypothetical protein EDX89_16860 [Acidobacteriota bacterium]
MRSGEPFLAGLGRGRTLLLPVGAFGVLTLLSALLSEVPSRTLPEVRGLWTFLLLPAALLVLRDREDVDLVLDALRLSAFCLVAAAAVELSMGRGDLETRLRGGTSNHMTFAGVLLPMVLALLARGVSSGGTRRRRTLDLAAAGLGTGVLVLTLTRNAYAGLLAGLGVLLVLLRPWLVAAVPAVLAAFLLLAPAAVRQRALSSFDPADPTVADRLLMWRAGLAMVEERPLVGMGPGQVNERYPRYRLPGVFLEKPGHLHNNVVMLSAETGVPSALAYLWFVGAALVAGARLSLPRAPAAARAVARGAVAALAALTVAGLFEFNFGDVEVLRLTLLLSCLPLAAAPAARQEALRA